MWTDTLSYELPADEGLVTMESITDLHCGGRYRGGRRDPPSYLLHFRADSHAEVSTQGMDVIQDPAGR